MTTTETVVNAVTAPVKEELASGIAAMTDKLLEASSILMGKPTEAAPQALDLMLNLIQFKSGFAIVLGLLFFAAFIFTSKRCKLNIDKTIEYAEKDDAMGIVNMLAAVVYGLVSAIFFMASLSRLISFENWIGLISPEGFLALRALETVGISL